MADGLEVHFIGLGKADSILLTIWNGDKASHLLIDGGGPGSTDTVLNYLLRRVGVKRLDHILCTHPHQDHAGGLPGIIASTELQIGAIWMHLPWQHISRDKLTKAASSSSTKWLGATLRKSLDDAASVESAAKARGITPTEPFSGMDIGPLKVIGPSLEYYETLLANFSDTSFLQASESAIEKRKAAVMAEKQEGMLTDPITEPENNSSVMTAMVHDKKKYLFTADAGVEALTMAKDAFNLAGCFFMQAPHHGSRHNITMALIDHFAPKTVFVSAPESDDSHPKPCVIDSLINKGAKVYSTGYPRTASLWHHSGSTPERAGYSDATKFWDGGRS